MLRASGQTWRIFLVILPGKIIPSCRKGHKVIEVLFMMRAMDAA